MTELEQALQLIDANPHQARFVGPRAESLIQAAETALGLSFPPTYRRFLGELGCGGIPGVEVYGIVDSNFVDSAIPDGIWLTLDERTVGNLPHSLLLISSTGDGGYYAIDTAQRDAQGESPIVLWFPGLSKPGDALEKVSNDFGTFLHEKLTEASG